MMNTKLYSVFGKTGGSFTAGKVKFRFWVVAAGLVLILGGSILLPPKGKAQDASTDSLKRKVRIKVAPEYPALAKQMNVTGKVKIETTIAADGHVENTKVIGGSPLLVNAALDAVKKWRFEPGPKDTTEVIEFEFSGQD
ncbi:MAG TPA: energy transducer TonB [Candidatus Acidoferrales bacterium]|jgi:TonB family protein|nr:energy transducer TonB [Candidatus Acidoferrales bacterium]